MISVIVPTLNAQKHLSGCFNSLISAATSGLVREVIVADGGSTDDTLFLADAAGAHVIAAPKTRAAQMEAGAKAAKCDWLLFLYPETTLSAGWEQEIEAFFDRYRPEKPKAAVFRLAFDETGARAVSRSIVAAVDGVLFGPSGRQGLLISRHLYQKHGGKHADIARRVGRRRLAMLRTRAIWSGEKFHAETQRFNLLAALKVPARVLARIYR